MESLISIPPSSALYHQIMLLIGLAGLAIAATTWRSPVSEGRTADHWRVRVLAFIGVFLFRLVPAAVSPDAAWAQPVERISDLGSLALLLWALVPAFHLRRHLSAAWLAVHGMLVLCYVGVTAMADASIVLPATHYNLVPPAYLLAICQVLTVVTAIVGLAVFGGEAATEMRPETRSLVLLALGTLLIGHDFHLLALAGVLPPYPAPDNVAVWVRCAQIIAYPVLVGALYCSLLFVNQPRHEP
jgi:hypothetical protein